MDSRILHVLGAPRAEGTPRLVLDWLSLQPSSQGVLCLAATPNELEADLREKANWWKEMDLIKPGWAKWRSIPAAVSAACEDFHPDIVISWPTWAAGLVGLGASRAGVRRLVQHCGNPARQGWRAGLLGDIRFFPFYMAGGIFACCSDYVRDSFRRRTFLFKDRFQTSYNCVQSEAIAARAARVREQRRGDERPTLLMVATMEDHKDHQTLLRAFVMFRRDYPHARLRLSGDGSLRRGLEAMTAELELGDSVDFLGARKDIPELLGDADLFVLSTTPQEGLGIVLLEAMAAGVAVVASDVPACRELLADRDIGLLVLPGDAGALNGGMRLAVSRHGLSAGADRIAKAQSHATAFTPSRMMAEYLALAQGTLAK